MTQYYAINELNGIKEVLISGSKALVRAFIKDNVYLYPNAFIAKHGATKFYRVN